MAESDSPLRSWQVSLPASSNLARRAMPLILAFGIIKLTFVGFSADAGTAAVGVFCELRAYVCGLRSGEGRCVGSLLYIGR